MSKTRDSCFITVQDISKQIKARGRRPSAFICFSVSGTRDEALILVLMVTREFGVGRFGAGSTSWKISRVYEATSEQG